MHVIRISEVSSNNGDATTTALAAASRPSLAHHPARWINVDLHFVEASLVKVPSFLVVYKAALGFNLD
jgi:hypothetical protein